MPTPPQKVHIPDEPHWHPVLTAGGPVQHLFLYHPANAPAQMSACALVSRPGGDIRAQSNIQGHRCSNCQTKWNRIQSARAEAYRRAQGKKFGRT